MDKDLVEIKLEIQKLGHAIERHNEVFIQHMREDQGAYKNFTDAIEKVSDRALAIQEQVIKLDKKLDLDEQQNKLLDEHIAGVNTLKEMHLSLKEEHDARLKELEQPKKFKEWLKKDLKYLLTIIGLIVGLFKDKLFP